MTGRLGGDGSKDELDALLRNIAASVVLRNEKKPPRATAASLAPATVSPSPLQQSSSSSSHASSCAGSTTASIESLSRSGSPPHVRTERATTVTPPEPASLAPSASPLANGLDPTPLMDDCESDNDAFNPFACAYRAPQSVAKDSLASSLASLANESTHSSIPDLATYDADTDARPFSASQRPPSRSHRDGSSDADDSDNDDVDGPGSPVHLCEYECLDMDAIPKYSVFKPSLQSRMQQQRLAATPAMSRSTGSIATAAYSATPCPGDESSALHRSVPSLESERRDSHAQAPAATHTRPHSSTATSHRRRSAPRIFDMAASYDFQREQAFNPFVSPPLAADREPLSPVGSTTAFELERARTSRIADDEDTSNRCDSDACEEPTRRVIERESDPENGDEDHSRREQATDGVALPAQATVRVRDEDDETSALIAAIAAASQDDDDFDLFGTGHAS